MTAMAKQFPFHTVRFLLIHVLQVYGLLFAGWDPYAVVVMWTFEIYILFFSELILYVSQKRKKGESWWKSWGVAFAYFAYWLTFGIAMYFFGVYLLSPVADLDQVGVTGGDVWQTTLAVMQQFWFMFAFILYDAVVNLRKELRYVPKDIQTISDGKALAYTFGFGICYMAAMAIAARDAVDATYALQEEGARLFALFFTLYMLVVGPLYIRKRETYEHK